MRGSVLANRSAVDRNKTDFYETPADVTTALINFLEQHNMIAPGCLIWEPACGRGAMTRIMLDRGYAIVGTDLYPKSDDLLSVDFLTADVKCNWIITNPPFSIADKFIRHALDLRRPCALLLKSQFWHARRRLDLWREQPPDYVLPLTWRPDFLFGAKSGAPTMECMWTVWANRSGITQYIPLERPKHQKSESQIKVDGGEA